MQNVLKFVSVTDNSPRVFWLCFVFLFLVVLALHGKPVPFNNEYLYLLRLEPNFLPVDWSFSRPANEHWLFNLIFSIPGYFLSIEVVGWLGRITFWLICLAGFLKLGKRWQISDIAVTASIIVWLAFGQSVVNAEWIFGGFEAKPVAYACLIFALIEFSKERMVLPSILLGLSFSFHPAVGLWAVPAVGMALLVERINFTQLLRVIGLTFAACLPGILPLISDRTAVQTATAVDWEFVVTKHMPFHFDPFYFSKIGMAVLAVMIIFNVAALWRSENFAIRFLRNFNIAVAGFFVLGVLMRYFEFYELLQYMPMRLFPILTPLFFLFTVFHAAKRLSSVLPVAALCFFAVAVLAPLHPFDEAIGQLRETKAAWVAPPNDNEISLEWISKNTPEDAMILAEPFGRKFWYLAKRPQAVSYSYPRYDRLAEWRSRIADLTNRVEIKDRASSRNDIEEAFRGLSAEQILELRQKYRASYLLSPTIYPFPVIFETDTYRVYRLP